MMYSN